MVEIIAAFGLIALGAFGAVGAAYFFVGRGWLEPVVRSAPPLGNDPVGAMLRWAQAAGLITFALVLMFAGMSGAAGDWFRGVVALTPNVQWPALSFTAWFVGMGLFLMSFWLTGVAIERVYADKRARVALEIFSSEISQRLREGRLNDAIELSNAREYRDSHIAKVVLAGLKEYQTQHGTPGPERIRKVQESIHEASEAEKSALRRGIKSLATIGAIAPFVGFVGTVSGLINAFEGISASGTSTIGAVSNGIAEALVQTALGLFVAIPAVWLYNYFTNRIETFGAEVEVSSSKLINNFMRTAN